MSLLGRVDPRFKESVFASLVPLQNDGFFPDVSTSVEVLQGAREAFKREADRLLAKVQTLVMRKGSEVERIEISGHGFGASFATLRRIGEPPIDLPVASLRCFDRSSPRHSSRIISSQHRYPH